MDAYRVRKLTNEIEGYKQFLYKPFYVKPQIFNVENNKLIDKKDLSIAIKPENGRNYLVISGKTVDAVTNKEYSIN